MTGNAVINRKLRFLGQNNNHGANSLYGRHFENYYEVNHCSSLRLLWNKSYTNEFLIGLYFPRGLLLVCPWVREWYFPHFHSSTNNNASEIRHVRHCDNYLKCLRNFSNKTKIFSSLLFQNKQKKNLSNGFTNSVHLTFVFCSRFEAYNTPWNQQVVESFAGILA